MNRYDPLIPAKASPDGKLDAFVVHGRADISTRTLLAAFSSSFAAASQARTSLSRLARSVILILLGQHQAVSGAGQNPSSLMSVRGIPWAFLSLRQVALNRLFVGAVRLAILPDASLASRRAFKRSVLARSASRSALYSDMALAPSVTLFLFELRFRPFPLLGVVGQRSLLLSLETRSSYSSRCQRARSSELPSRLAAVLLVRTRGGPVRTIPAPTTLSAAIQATEALASKRRRQRKCCAIFSKLPLSTSEQSSARRASGQLPRSQFLL